jgi:GAF domain-containing protein/HPt (histidine-containing phosphotransfer) domain-containing protein
MDSALLDQVRHLCRDRAAYERLKAILVQQERVHQLSWEDQHEKLISTNSTDPNSLDSKASDIFKNIIAREKALAQLADAIQRSPSLELVLQIAVQVAQKLLQVDRVVIFRAHPDGRGEFAIDATAAGGTSLADMPERQLSLARYMIEHAAQTIDSIRSSSLSSHMVTLLEQIGISSYAANKIYAGQEIWGTLVAFEGGAYHSWSESDRTSLSLIAAQIGIAISLTDLRQQSQELTDDLRILRIELDNLQQTVIEIAESTSTNSGNNSTITSDIAPIFEAIAKSSTQDVVEDEQIDDFISNDLEPDNLEPDNLEPEISQVDQDEEENEIFSNEEIVDFAFTPIPENGLPPLFSIPDSSTSLMEDIDENIRSVESAINSEEPVPMFVIANDNLKSASFSESEQEEIEQEEFVTTEADITLSEAYNSELNKIELAELEKVEAELVEAELAELERAEAELAEAENHASNMMDLQLSQIENLEPEDLVLENLALEEDEQVAIAPEAAESQIIESQIIESQLSETKELEGSEQDENTSVELVEPELVQQESIESEILESEIAQIDNFQIESETTVDEDEEPAIEPEYIETILEISGNDLKATDFLLDVIDTYLEDAPRLVQAIDKAIAINDHLRILQSLNTLRSSSHNIGALKLSYQCRQLESAVKANYVVLVYACLSQVAIEVQRVTDALRIERSRYSQNSDHRRRLN